MLRESGIIVNCPLCHEYPKYRNFNVLGDYNGENLYVVVPVGVRFNRNIIFDALRIIGDVDEFVNGLVREVSDISDTGSLHIWSYQ